MTAKPDLIENRPGESPEAPGLPAHQAVSHMLDVAAAAEILTEDTSFAPGLRDAVILPVARHDLGKIGASFRATILTGESRGQYRHWQVTEARLDHHRETLFARPGGDPDAHFELYAAPAGHHGRPPTADASPLPRGGYSAPTGFGAGLT